MTTNEIVKIALELSDLEALPMDSSVEVEGEQITNILAGIDMTTAELHLAKQLGYDCVVRHHNIVPILGHLGDLVAKSHFDKMKEHGIAVNIAEKLMHKRKREIAEMFHGSNLDAASATARLLEMPFVGLHTPADLIGERIVSEAVSSVYEAIEDPTVQDLLDKIMTIREFKEAPDGQRPEIWVGSPESLAGKAIVEFAGGLAAELDEMKAYIDAGVGTFVCMHLKSDIAKALREDNRCNVIVTGHMASDSIGMNVILDHLETLGVKTTRIGGMV
jgi:hypothetical protein